MIQLELWPHGTTVECVFTVEHAPVTNHGVRHGYYQNRYMSIVQNVLLFVIVIIVAADHHQAGCRTQATLPSEVGLQ
jgi:hypothetical protein